MKALHPSHLAISICPTYGKVYECLDDKFGDLNFKNWKKIGVYMAL